MVFCFADIGAWDIGKVFLHTLPEITAWVVVLASVGLLLGVIALMTALRFLLPWSRLHELRQGPRGWIWMTVQWCWVLLWGLSLPLLGTAIGGLSGSAIGARRLVLREHVGQVVGERLLGPVCVQVARQLETRYPQYGKLSSASLEPTVIPGLLDRITPQVFDQALGSVKMLDESDPSASPLELVARKYLRRGIRYASQRFFREKTRFIHELAHELQPRAAKQGGKACLHDVVACASHLYFTPAFANWTFWWVFAHGAILVSVMSGVLLLPPLLFGLFWWWRQRRPLRTASEPSPPPPSLESEGGPA